LVIVDPDHSVCKYIINSKKDELALPTEAYYSVEEVR
jgi:hypothetical protein